MLHADGALNSGQRDVEALSGELPFRRRRLDGKLCRINSLLDVRLQFVHPLPDVALGVFRSSLQPAIVDLRKQAIPARQPAVAKGFPVGLRLQRSGLHFKRSKEVSNGLIQRGRREIFEFGNGVHMLRGSIPLWSSDPSRGVILMEAAAATES